MARCYRLWSEKETVVAGRQRKEMNPTVQKQIKSALKLGFEEYKKNGWV